MKKEREANNPLASPSVRRSAVPKRPYRLPIIYVDKTQRDPRPLLRSECEDGIRPCPYIGCRDHLLIELTKSGKIKPVGGSVDSTDEEIVELLLKMPETCSRDIGEELTWEAIGKLLGVSKVQARRQYLKARAKALHRGQPLIDDESDEDDEC